ncbi:MAG: ABC transporter permease [Clostridium sp.]
MGKYILKRIGFGFITVFIIITATFFLVHSVPGDPMAAGAKNLSVEAKAAFKHKYGLDKPLIQQYTTYMTNLITKGDLGDSMIYRERSIGTMIKVHAPTSGKVGGIAIVIQVTVGVVLGIIAAFNRGKFADKVISVLVVCLVCIPSFVFAALLQYIFAVKLRMFPVMGWGQAKHYFIPVLAMSIGGIASYCKFTRNSTLGVIGQDYIITAKAKGVGKIALTVKHVLRNSMIPIVTMVGPSILNIFAGSFVIESMFSIPGLGFYYVTAVNSADFSMVVGLTIFISSLYVLSLILVDISYGIIDPRIRVASGSR